MKVILLQDVAKLGRRMDVVTVPDGYGMNKLVPQGMAEVASPENIKKVAAQSAKTEVEREVSAAAFSETIATLKGKVIDVIVGANEEGKMYQALKSDEIADAIGVAEKIKVDADKIVIKTPIKLIGEHTIELISGDLTGSLIVNVIMK